MTAPLDNDAERRDAKRKSDIHVRLDPETYAAITVGARNNGRSINEEIIVRLHGSRPERVTELLAANNREVERRQEAEQALNSRDEVLRHKDDILRRIGALVADTDASLREAREENDRLRSRVNRYVEWIRQHAPDVHVDDPDPAAPATPSPAVTDDNAPRYTIAPHPWERPHGDPERQDRDIEAAPYDRQEQRVVNFLWARGLGGGDDPIGFLMASHAYSRAELNRARTALPPGVPCEACDTPRDCAKFGQCCESYIPFEGSTPAIRQALAGLAVLRRVLDLIGTPDTTDHDLAKLVVDNELDLRALLDNG